VAIHQLVQGMLDHKHLLQEQVGFVEEKDLPKNQLVYKGNS